MRFLFQRGHWVLCPLFVLISGCVNPGVSQDEYNLARAAFKAAQEGEAKRYAPKIFYKAQGLYRRGERAYSERYYDEASEHFKKSRYYFEKAEALSRLKLFKQGEMAP
ncbi:MAG: DUF4398 domain-containing protein [Bdellovibrionales bacterium]|nr:DUF4398 domain-containing protein [Bdellovibrionales bacterium]